MTWTHATKDPQDTANALGLLPQLVSQNKKNYGSRPRDPGFYKCFTDMSTKSWAVIQLLPSIRGAENYEHSTSNGWTTRGFPTGTRAAPLQTLRLQPQERHATRAYEVRTCLGAARRLVSRFREPGALPGPGVLESVTTAGITTAPMLY